MPKALPSRVCTWICSCIILTMPLQIPCVREVAMRRMSPRPKVESFNFRVDPELKAAFTAATAEADKPAGQVLRDFMRAYVERRRQRTFAAEAQRQSRLTAEAAADPTSDEAEVMRWIEDVSDTGGWTA